MVAARHVIENALQNREYPSDIPQFSKLRVEKILKDNIHNSLQLPQKYTLIFVREISVPRTGQFSESVDVMKNRACCLSL